MGPLSLRGQSGWAGAGRATQEVSGGYRGWRAYWTVGQGAGGLGGECQGWGGAERSGSCDGCTDLPRITGAFPRISGRPLVLNLYKPQCGADGSTVTAHPARPGCPHSRATHPDIRVFSRTSSSTRWSTTRSRRRCWQTRGRSAWGTATRPTSPTCCRKVGCWAQARFIAAVRMFWKHFWSSKSPENWSARCADFC